MADKKLPPWLMKKKGGDDEEEDDEKKPGKKMSPADRLKAFKKARDAKKKK